MKTAPETNTNKLEDHQQNAQSAACNLEILDKRLKEAEVNNTSAFTALQTYITQLSHQVAIATDHLSQAGINQSKHLEQRMEELTSAAGVYTEIYDVSDLAFRVYRDGRQHHGYGGNWTVFQRRMDGSVDFNRSWSDYKYGFGDLHGEHWLGLQKLLRILSSERHELLIELEDFGGNIVYARYDDFQLESEGKWYKIKSLGSYSGTAGDSMENYVGRAFVTYGRRDVNKCAIQFQGGGWFDKCYSMHLNGPYKTKGEQTTQEGIHWGTYRGFYYSLKATKMMVRPYRSNA
uniref:Fibrinogen C-terminal domain-containing protein n=1 Tax=Anopheles dirus TaxID=7168 RepID=A0A182MY97_9DIPT